MQRGLRIVMVKLCSLVEFELQNLREQCNFTPDELAYFNLKAKDKSNVQIAEIMHVSESKVSCLARQVKSKIGRVL